MITHNVTSVQSYFKLQLEGKVSFDIRPIANYSPQDTLICHEIDNSEARTGRSITYTIIEVYPSNTCNVLSVKEIERKDSTDI